MTNGGQFPLEEFADLKQRIAEAVRKTLREMADERGMSVADFIDSLSEGRSGNAEGHR